MNFDLRIRFDDRFSTYLDELRDTGFFMDLASIALFCAALGFKNKNKVVARGNRDVRYGVLLGTVGASQLVDSIFLLEHSEDMHDLLREETVPSRVKLFEQYCNGGLEGISNLRKSGRPMTAIIPDLINQEWGQNA